MLSGMDAGSAMAMAEELLGGEPMIGFVTGDATAFKIEVIGGLLDFGLGRCVFGRMSHGGLRCVKPW